ncbi:MAG: TetR/AcrR family transcriptional regulator [Myxococcota bacterium]
MAYRKTERVREHLAGVREALLREGRQLVATEGFAGLQVARLAERAGVATGTIYGHFPNKGALCAEVFAVASQREVDLMRQVLEQPGPVVERLAAATRTWCERAQRGRVLARALLTEPVDPAVEEARLVYRAAYAAVIADTLREGITTGELPAQDAEVSAACVVGALAEAVLGPVVGVPDGASGRDPTVSIVRFCLAALGAPP